MARKPNRARDDLAKQLRLDMAFAQKRLLEAGEVSPMFVIHGTTETIVVGCQWESDADKDRACAMVRLACIAHDAQALSQITEAWIRQLTQYPGETDAEFQARQDAVRPADAEDRREVVICTLTWRDEANERHTLSDTREIERRANGKPSGLKLMAENTNYDQTSGRMVEILPSRPPTPTEREAAKAVLAMAKGSRG